VARSFSLSLGRYKITLGLSRAPQPVAAPTPLAPPSPVADPGDPIMEGYVLAMERRFPALHDFGFTVTPQNAADICAFYADYIPLQHAPSRGAFLRGLLHRLCGRTADPAIKALAIRAIAASDLADGMPDRSKSLRGDPQYDAEWQAQTDALEASYGASLVREDWSSADRGKCLIAYFDAHRALLRGRDILHLAPEGNLRDWFNSHRSEFSIGRYRTADAYGDNLDENHDITAIDVPDGSFDMVICHRVMEHVLDDAKGFSELFRILRPGGLLSFSVPQATHRSQTAEWIIPDETHHWHVRQYGADLEDRMRKAGFRIEIERWLIQKPPDVLRAMDAYPMRIYHAWRDR
jgi:SAM-dependent methyltransferase